MKCKNYRKLACCAAMLLLVFAGRAFAYDFSAEFVEKDGAEIQKGKIYISGEMSRYEVDGSEAIQVTRADKKVMWIVFPKHRVYVEEAFAGPVSIGSGTAALPKNTGDLSREDLGFEEVDSYRLRKYLVTVKYNKGETQDKYYEWRRSDFPVPVKTANLSGTVSYEYKKIKMGPQNPSFFVEPKSYKKVTAEELEKLEAQWSAKKKK
ncbi:MAG: hypothetical protein RR340_03815 [Cloacibacillus sp.]